MAFPVSVFADTALSETRANVSRQKAVFENDKAQMENYKAGLNNTKTKLRETVGRILRVTESIGKVNSDIESINLRIGDEEKLLFSKNKQLALRAINIYKVKDQTTLWIILSFFKGDLSKSIELITYLVEVEHQDADLVRKLDEATRVLRQKRTELRLKKSQKTDLYSQLRNEEKSFSDVLAQNQTVYDKAFATYKQSAVKYQTAKSEYNSKLIKQRMGSGKTNSMNNSDPQLRSAVSGYLNGNLSPAQLQMAARIRNFISSQFPSSPLIGQEEAFVKAGELYNIDPRLLPSIAKKESGCATAYSDSYNNQHHNAWGYGPGMEFGSWKEAIFVITAHIADKWGENAQPKDLEGYCVPSHPWIEDVTGYMNSI